MKIRDVYGLDCVYCGEAATHREHVVPLSLTGEARRGPEADNHDKVVPACRDCNLALHNLPLLTIAERAEWLLDRFNRKLAARKDEGWTDEAIRELGRSLRRRIQKLQKERQILVRRINHTTSLLQNIPRNATPEKYWAEL